jgi:hypothetical protein
MTIPLDSIISASSKALVDEAMGLVEHVLDNFPHHRHADYVHVLAHVSHKLHSEVISHGADLVDGSWAVKIHSRSSLPEFASMPADCVLLVAMVGGVEGGIIIPIPLECPTNANGGDA